MTSTPVHTFAADDARARFTMNDGRVYRAVRLRRDSDGELSIDAVQLTKRGTDYKRGACWVWLTLTHSLGRFAWGAGIAEYVREVAAEVTA